MRRCGCSRRPFKQELARLNRFRRGTAANMSSHNLVVDPESAVAESGNVSPSGAFPPRTGVLGDGKELGRECPMIFRRYPLRINIFE